jgi:GNAT superfamily N-acetyltransferase
VVGSSAGVVGERAVFVGGVRVRGSAGTGVEDEDGVVVAGGGCGGGVRVGAAEDAAQITRLARSRLIQSIDDLPVWSIVCVVVRPGHRRQGVTAPLLEGAVAYGVPAVEAYPVDRPGRMHLTMAFVGTKSIFERAGFRLVGTTNAVASGMPRLVMRRDLP